MHDMSPAHLRLLILAVVDNSTNYEAHHNINFLHSTVIARRSILYSNISSRMFLNVTDQDSHMQKTKEYTKTVPSPSNKKG
jgi:hypothetical protein